MSLSLVSPYVTLYTCLCHLTLPMSHCIHVSVTCLSLCHTVYMSLSLDSPYVTLYTCLCHLSLPMSHCTCLCHLSLPVSHCIHVSVPCLCLCHTVYTSLSLVSPLCHTVYISLLHVCPYVTLYTCRCRLSLPMSHCVHVSVTS